jgi:hypothetical protein
MADEQVIEDVPKSFIEKHMFKFKMLVAFLVIFAFGWILSDAFVVHGNNLPDDYWSSTSVLKDKLLDKEGFLAGLAIMTMITIVVFAWGYWKIHSLPKKHSEHTGQPRLVLWLCMLGFFCGWLWIAAILIVVTDWEKIAEVISGRKSVMQDVAATDNSVKKLEESK